MPLAIILVAGCGTGDKLTPAKTSDAPTGLVATVLSKTEIGLTWKDNSSDEDGFNIQRKEGPSGVFLRIALVGADVTTYRDRGSNNLTPNTTYYYRVAYYRGSDVSEYSMAASATTLKKSLSLKKIEMTQLSPYVGIVLRLLTGEADLIDEDKIPIPEDGSCPYEGWETYIPEELNDNTIRKTFIYERCKKDHPVASDIVVRYNGRGVINYYSPNYRGSDPLRAPYLPGRAVTKHIESLHEEEFDSQGMVLQSGVVYEDFTMTATEIGDDVWYWTMEGTIIPDSCGGKRFVLKTLLPLYRPFTSACPLGGEIVVTGDDRGVTLRFLDNQTTEVDVGSDGFVDETANCQVVMNSDVCM